jgi:ABC-type branched-subunit amino acid transport system substrate-binding protein
LALTGNLAEHSFADLIQFYSLKRETVALRVKSDSPGSPEGIFYLERGELVHAQFGDRSGLDAVRTALKLRDGPFRVDQNVKPPQRTIFEKWNKVLLEESWLQDEEERQRVSGHTVLPQPVAQSQTNASIDDDWKTPTAFEEDWMSTTPSQGQHKATQSNRDFAVTAGSRLDSRLRRNVVIAAIGVALLAGLGGILFSSGSKKEAPPIATADAMPVATPATVPVPAAAVTPPPVIPLVQGVTEKEIVFGQAVPLTGAAKELGRQMKTGVGIAFEAINEGGGVNGRKLRLVTLDDGYEPERNKVVMKELAETQKVFGFVGNVGTPTAAVAIPYALEKKMLFFGAFTGASLLRKDPPDRYVFNYRASYAEETAAAVKYLIEVRRIRPAEIAVFAQNDKYGDAGFEGVARMLRRYKRDPSKILRVGYERNTADVHAAVNEIFRNSQNVRAVVMVPTYKAAAQFISKLKDKGANLIYTSVSFVGSNALAEELTQLGKGYAEGVIVTQVVPLPDSSSTAVLRYRELLNKYAPGEKPDFVSLEGYIAGTLLVEALKRVGPDLNTESVIATLEGVKGLDMGLGATINFGLSEHQASHKVWGSLLDSRGIYQSLELD